jgi:hypothetical protein
MSVTKPRFLNMEVLMNGREYSDIREREYRCLWLVIKIDCKPITTIGGVSSVLRTEQNNICVANVTGRSARKYKEVFSTEIEVQGSLYPVLLSTVSSQVRTAVCKCLFRSPSAVIF